jgi:hypothetical protein
VFFFALIVEPQKTAKFINRRITMKSFIYRSYATLLLVFAFVLGSAAISFAQAADAPAQNSDAAKQTIKIGLPGVKAGAVGEGMNGQELAAAIQNSLGDYLKGTKVEIVPLEAKLASTMADEAAEKQCDFILYAQVSHKKGGGGGFAKMFSAVAPMMGNMIPMAGAGAGAAIAGSVVTTAAMTAANASSNVKAKDEITLDIKLQRGANVTLAKQLKAKAGSAGEDIISPMMEQAAQAILDAVSK